MYCNNIISRVFCQQSGPNSAVTEKSVPTCRTDPKSNAPIMMLSAGNGFIMQSEKYSRDNAGQSLKKYILLKQGELAYNHGAYINGKWYVFYHRNTHKSAYSRQACAEPITLLPDGTIAQVEITSQGFGGPLTAEKEYPASVCCNLYRGKMPHSLSKLAWSSI